jgi:predicted acetyltransferase
MDFELRPVAPERMRAFLEVTETSFGADLPDDVFESLRHVVESDRAMGAYEGGTMVGTAGAYSLRMTVPGGQVACAGVSLVGVVPSHRRRGVMTLMMTSQLREIRERGEPIAALWASEDSIYGRFGYGTASMQALIDVPRVRATFLDDSPVRGRVRLVDREEAIQLFPAVYERVRGVTPGMFVRSEAWWRHRVLRDASKDEDGPFFRALLEHEGEPAGYVVYRVQQRWERGVTQAAVDLREVMAATPAAMLDAWKFAFGIDLVESIRTTSFFLPSHHPLLLMVEQPRYLGFLLSNGLWLRIVDVASALAARGYTGSGSVTVAVRDPLFEENSKTWRMEVDDGAAQVAPTDAAPDVALGIAELGSIYLGEFTFSEMAAAGRVSGEAAALARADSLWRTSVAPWCPEIF